MIDEILSLAGKLPTGLPDNEALRKMEREKEELSGALKKRNPLNTILEAADCAYYAIKAEASNLIDVVERNVLIQQFSSVVNVPPSLLLECVKAKYELRARPGNPKDPRAERKAVKRLVNKIQRVRIEYMLSKALLTSVREGEYDYPLKVSVNTLIKTVYSYLDEAIDVVYLTGYLNGFFNTLNILGILKTIEENGNKTILFNEAQVATIRALCLASEDKVSDLFYYANSERTSNSEDGIWFLSRIEERRKASNSIREPSRICTNVVVMVKARLDDGKDAVLLQHDNAGPDKYILIGGQIRANDDGGSWETTARREIKQEVRSENESAYDIQLTLLSHEPLVHLSTSKRLGAYTLYRVYVCECTLTLPMGCLRETFIGEKQRKTRWFPLDQITSENQEISYQGIMGRIQKKGWFGSAQLSTDQLVTRDPIDLPGLVKKHFNDSELKDICFDLGLDYEELPGLIISEKVLELVSYFERRKNSEVLVKALVKHRPLIRWD